MALFLILLLLPLVEITLFIQIGGEIGLAATLGWCALSAALGLLMLQYQGVVTMAAIREALAKGDLPVREAFDGICFFLAGILFLLPGFATDFAGFLLCLPWVRDALQSYLARFFVGAPVRFRRDHRWQEQNEDSDAIDVEYSHIYEDPEYIEKRLEDRRNGH
jgi:UPF0716 protein FxsA